MNYHNIAGKIVIACLVIIAFLVALLVLASCTPVSSVPISSFATAETVFTAVAPTSNQESIDVDGNTVHAESFDWGGAQISEYPHWCPKPPDPEYWFQGNQFTILLVDGQEITITKEGGMAKITLKPKILMVSQELSKMFNGFELEESEMLAIYLVESGTSFEVLFCSESIFLTWTKG